MPAAVRYVQGEPAGIKARGPHRSVSTLRIEGYDQDSLSVTTQGAATVAAEGRARLASVTMQGRSDVNLSRLTVENLDGKVGGAGTLVAAPTRVANLEVRDLASAVLLSRPVELNTRLTDEGRVIDAAIAP